MCVHACMNTHCSREWGCKFPQQCCNNARTSGTENSCNACTSETMNTGDAHGDAGGTTHSSGTVMLVAMLTLVGLCVHADTCASTSHSHGPVASRLRPTVWEPLSYRVAVQSLILYVAEDYFCFFLFELLLCVCNSLLVVSETFLM